MYRVYHHHTIGHHGLGRKVIHHKIFVSGMLRGHVYPGSAVHPRCDAFTRYSNHSRERTRDARQRLQIHGLSAHAQIVRR